MFTVTIRADASTQIGTGHVMRCLTLADVLKGRGATCRFICREHDGNLLDAIRRRGYEANGLAKVRGATALGARSSGLQHEDWLGVDWEHDAHETAAAIND